MRRHGAAAVVVMVVRRAEDEKLEWRLGGDEVNEGRGGEDLIEIFANAAADHDLTEGERGEDLVERVLRETVDWGILHFRGEARDWGLK